MVFLPTRFPHLTSSKYREIILFSLGTIDCGWCVVWVCMCIVQRNRLRRWVFTLELPAWPLPLVCQKAQNLTCPLRPPLKSWLSLEPLKQDSLGFPSVVKSNQHHPAHLLWDSKSRISGALSLCVWQSVHENVHSPKSDALQHTG